MTNRFYDNVNDLIPMTRARAQSVEDNFNAVEAAFDLIQVEVNASIRGPDNETLGRLPSAGSRVNKGLVFDASGQPGVATLATQSEMNAAVQAASDSLSYLNSFRGQYLGPLAADPSVDALGNAVNTGDIYYNTVSARLKVYTGSTWANGVDTSVGGTVPDTRLISTGAGLTGGGNLTADRTLSIANNGVTDAMLRQGAATSLIGRSAGTSGNVADIAATVDDRFLVRRSGALTFGALVSGDVTSALGFTPADTAGQYYTGTHNFGVALQVAGNAVWHAGNFDKTLYAPIANPTLTGTVTIPEPPSNSNNQTAATTAFVIAKMGAGGYVPTARQVATGTGLTGGGDLSLDRTISFNESGYGDLRYMKLTGGTFTGIIVTPLSSSGGAGFRLPHGADPSSPVNGDLWTTAATFKIRINGSTRTMWHDGNFTPSDYQTVSGMSSYLTTAAASSTYQTQAGMSSYLTTASASSTYLTQSSASSTYAPKASPTFTGTMTLSGTGQMLKIGDDASFHDINVGNTMGLYGQTDSTVGAMKFGSSGPTLTGNSSGFTSTGTFYAPAFQVSSQRVLKQDITPIAPGALERVMKWRIEEYAYKATPSERVIGLMADDADRRISNGLGIDLRSALFELAASVQELARRH